MSLARRLYGFFTIHGRHSFLCSEPYGYRNRSCAGSPLPYVPEAETGFSHSPHRSLPGGSALFHHEHFRFGLGAGEENDSRRGKTARY